MNLQVTTGDLPQWADTLEKSAYELGERMAKQVKSGFEHQRKQRNMRFKRIKRMKSGKRRFVAKKPPIDKAAVPGKSFAAHFKDIFDEA